MVFLEIDFKNKQRICFACQFC